MASPDRSLPVPSARRRFGVAALPSLLLTALVLPLPALADRPENRPSGFQQQEAQGLARLSTPELRNYFEARRQLERREGDQRLADLRQLEDCLERTRLRAGAETCLSQARERREQLRQRGLTELSALRQRYGLPPMPGVASVQTRPIWVSPQPRQPQAQQGYSSRYPAGSPYGYPSRPAYGWY